MCCISIYFLAVLSSPTTLPWSKLHYWWHQSNAKGLIAYIKPMSSSLHHVGNQRRPYRHMEISHSAQMAVIFLMVSHPLCPSPLSLLQIDAVSLFLLYLVEMICSGLQIIYNTDEVNKTPRWLPRWSILDIGDLSAVSFIGLIFSG